MDLRRWIGASSATLRARAARPRIRRARLTSGRARKRVKRAARAGWRAIAASRNSSRRPDGMTGADNPQSAIEGNPNPERMMGTDNLPVDGLETSKTRCLSRRLPLPFWNGYNQVVHALRLALGRRSTVGHLPLEQVIGVRIPASQPTSLACCSFSRLGPHVFSHIATRLGSSRLGSAHREWDVESRHPP